MSYCFSYFFNLKCGRLKIRSFSTATKTGLAFCSNTGHCFLHDSNVRESVTKARRMGCGAALRLIGALRRIRPLISQSAEVLVYNSLIQPHFDYCSLVWDLSDQLSDKLQKLQNRAARVILKANYGTSSNLLLDILKWDNLVIRRKKHKAIMMFKSLNKQAPVYLQNLFVQFYERSTDHDLRNFFRKLTLPRPRTNYLKQSFSYSAALLWNSLPENVREIKSIREFKEQIKHLFESSDPHSAVTRQSLGSLLKQYVDSF